MRQPRNMAASVRQRLLNLARSDKRPFNELLQYYAMERFLFRLSQSSHANRFILKGALLLRVWGAAEIRPTKDIDLLGKTSNNVEKIIEQIRDILSVDVLDDGLVFGSDTIRAERITEEADYEGIRIKFTGALETARITMQIDIGFGDSVHPEPKEADFPTLLDLPSPKVLCYSRESSIAEKIEAMVKLGELNSRMKDFYDIWFLSRQFSFDGEQLAEAIRKTFQKRHTSLPSSLTFVNEAFIEVKQVQWEAFIKRLQNAHVPVSFKVVLSTVLTFLSPIIKSLSAEIVVHKYWDPPGPWQ